MASKKRFWRRIVLSISIGGLVASGGDLRLVNAAKIQDAQTVRSLLKQRVNVNAAAPDGTTALSWVTHWNDATTADLLIHAGANVNAANDYGVTPLWLACSNANGSLVEKLLNAHAAPDVRRDGETPLMRCSRSGSLSGVTALLTHGADVNARETHQEQTALMWAVAEKHSDVAKVLIEKGADIRARSKRGSSALLLAARSGDLESGRALLAAGADVNDAAEDGLTALLVASASGHEPIAVLLVEKGANPNATDGYGLTPLHYAVLKGLTVIRGIIYDAELSYLFRPEMPELVKALLAHGAKPNVRTTKELPLLTRERNRQYMRNLGSTPFLFATAAGNTDIMRLLVAGGADPLLATNDKVTPLMTAAGVGQIYGTRTKEEAKRALDAVKLAVEMGADVNAADNKGATALHGAAYRGANDIIQFLADKGGRLDVMDKYGHTPLAIAEGDLNILRDERERRHYPSTAELIRKLGGDVLAQGTILPSVDVNQ